MELDIQVQSVMQRHLVTVHMHEPIRDVTQKLTEHHVSAVPVVDQHGHVQGIISTTDVLRRILQDEDCLDYENVSGMMTGVAVTMRQDQSMQEAARLMLQHQIHHIPVVSDDKRLVGIVSSVDFVRLAAEDN
jgi:CBS domain-containing protein